MAYLKETFEALAEVGWQGSASDQGRDCLTYSPNEDLAHRRFSELVNALRESANTKGMQLDLKNDPFGNSHAILAGQSSREIMICSHLDSVIHGGKFDGVLGVSAGLDVLRRFIENGEIPAKTLHVVGFRGEESSVTGHACLGSALATGDFDLDKLRRQKHTVFNKSLLEVLMDRGVNEDHLNGLREKPFIDGSNLDAVIELHVEQSSVLDELNQPVGIVVRGIGGARRSDWIFSGDPSPEVLDGNKLVRLVFYGEAGHSGGLPMNGEVILDRELKMRKDAVTAMARFLSATPGVRRLIRVSAPEGTYNTVPSRCVVECMIEQGTDVEALKEQIKPFLKEGMKVECEEMVPSEQDLQLIRENVADAALRAIVECERLAEETARRTGGAVRITVGKANSKEGQIFLGVDQRRLDNEVAEQVNQHLQSYLRRVEQEHRIIIREDNVVLSPATPLSAPIAQVMSEAHRDLFGYEPAKLGSMPGHDASKVIRSKGRQGFVPGGMIFVRSRNGGISHHPHESSAMEDIEKAADLLFETIKRL